MLDLDVVTGSGTRRVFSFLHKAQPVLLNFGEPRAIEMAPWSDRVPYVEARYAPASGNFQCVARLLRPWRC